LTHVFSSKLDCVFSHFAESDQCPSCGAKPLGESDFTELVVSESTLAPNLLKTCFQTLLCTRPNSHVVTFPEACASILRQMEALKTTTKFLLKQMIKDSTSKSQMHQGYTALKQQCLDQKQQIASLQDCHQRAMNEVNNKLHNKEKANADLQSQLRAFRRDDISNQTTCAEIEVPTCRQGEPPLLGILAQKQQREADVRAQQEAIFTGRPTLLSRTSISNHLDSRNSSARSSTIKGQINSMIPSNSGDVAYHASTSPMMQARGPRRSNVFPVVGGGPIRTSGTAHRQLQQHITPMQTTTRLYSGGSNGSGNRIRGLTATSGYNFTSMALGGRVIDSSSHVNKRRAPNTPTSIGNSPSNGRFGMQPYSNHAPTGKENPYL
jgi:hypothetical protein